MTKLTEQLDCHRRRYGITSKNYGQASLKGPHDRGSLLWDSEESVRVTISQSHGLAVNALGLLASMDSSLHSHLSWLTSEIKTRQFMTMAECADTDNRMKSLLYQLGERWITVEGLLITEFFIRCYSAHISLVNSLFYMSLPFHNTSLFVRVTQVLDIPDNSPLVFLQRVAEVGIPIDENNLGKRLSKIPNLLANTIENLLEIIDSTPANRLYVNFLHKLVNLDSFVVKTEESVQLVAKLIYSTLPRIDLTLTAHSLVNKLYSQTDCLFSHKFNTSMLLALLENSENPYIIFQMIHHQAVPTLFGSKLCPQTTAGLGLLFPMPRSLTGIVLVNATLDTPSLHSAVRLVVGSLLMTSVRENCVAASESCVAASESCVAASESCVAASESCVDEKSELRLFLEALLQNSTFGCQETVMAAVFDIMQHAIKFKEAQLTDAKSVLCYLHTSAPLAFLNKLRDIDEGSDFGVWLLTVIPTLDYSFARKYCAAPTKRSASETMLRKIKGLIKFGASDSFLLDIFNQGFSDLELNDMIATIEIDTIYQRIWVDLLTPEKRAQHLAKFLDLNLRRNLGVDFDVSLAKAFGALASKSDLCSNLSPATRTRIINLASRCEGLSDYSTTIIAASLKLKNQPAVVPNCFEALRRCFSAPISPAAHSSSASNLILERMKIGTSALALHVLSATRSMSAEMIDFPEIIEFFETELASALIQLPGNSVVETIKKAIVPSLIKINKLLVPVLLGDNLTGIIDSPGNVAPLVFRLLEFLKNTENTDQSVEIIEALRIYPQFIVDSLKLILASFRPSDRKFLKATAQLRGLPTTSLPTTSLPTTSLPTTSLPTNGLLTTGLPTNGLPTNGLPTNGLPNNGLPDCLVIDLKRIEKVSESVLKSITKPFNSMESLPRGLVQFCAPWIVKYSDLMKTPIEFILSHQTGPESLFDAILRVNIAGEDGGGMLSIFKTILPRLHHRVNQTEPELFHAFINRHADDHELKEVVMNAFFETCSADVELPNNSDHETLIRCGLILMDKLPISRTQVIRAWLTSRKNMKLSPDFIREHLHGPQVNSMLQVLKILIPYQDKAWISECAEIVMNPSFLDSVLEKEDNITILNFVNILTEICNSSHVTDEVVDRLIDRQNWDVHPSLKEVFDYVLKGSGKAEVWLFLGAIFKVFKTGHEILFKNLVECNIESLVSGEMLSSATTTSLILSGSHIFGPYNDNHGRWKLLIDTAVAFNLDLKSRLSTKSRQYASQFGHLDLSQPDIPAIRLCAEEKKLDMEWDICLRNLMIFLQNIANISDKEDGKIYCTARTIDSILSSWSHTSIHGELGSKQSVIDERRLIEQIVKFTMSMDIHVSAQIANIVVENIWALWIQFTVGDKLPQETVYDLTRLVTENPPSLSEAKYVPIILTARMGLALILCRQTATDILAGQDAERAQAASLMYTVGFKILAGLRVLRPSKMVEPISKMVETWLQEAVRRDILQTHYIISQARGCDRRVRKLVLTLILKLWPETCLDNQSQSSFDKATVSHVCDLVGDLIKEEEDPEIQGKYLNWGSVFAISAASDHENLLRSLSLWLPILAESVAFCVTESTLPAIALVSNVPQASEILMPYMKKLGHPVLEAMAKTSTDFCLLCSCLLGLGPELLEVKPEALDLISWGSLHWGVNDLSISEFWTLVQESAESFQETCPAVTDYLKNSVRNKILKNRKPISILSPGKIYGVILRKCCTSSMSTERLFKKFSIRLRDLLKSDEDTTSELLHTLGSFGTVVSLIDADGLKSVLPSLIALVAMLFSYFTGSTCCFTADRQSAKWFDMFDARDFAKCYHSKFLSAQVLGFDVEDTEYDGVFDYDEQKVNKDLGATEDVLLGATNDVLLGAKEDVLLGATKGGARSSPNFFEIENIMMGFVQNIIRKCTQNQARELVLGLLKAARNSSQLLLAVEEKRLEDLVNARLFYMCYLSIATKWGAVEYLGLEEDFVSTFRAVRKYAKERCKGSNLSIDGKKRKSAIEIDGTFWWYEVGMPAILALAEVTGKADGDLIISNDLCKSILGLYDIVQYMPRFACLQSYADQYKADYYTRSWILALRKLVTNGIGMMISNTMAMSFTYSLLLEKISCSLDIRIKTSIARSLVQAWRLNVDGLSVVLTDTLKTLVELMDNGDSEVNALAKYWIHTIERLTGQSLAPRLAF